MKKESRQESWSTCLLSYPTIFIHSSNHMRLNSKAIWIDRSQSMMKFPVSNSMPCLQVYRMWNVCVQSFGLILSVNYIPFPMNYPEWLNWTQAVKDETHSDVKCGFPNVIATTVIPEIPRPSGMYLFTVTVRILLTHQLAASQIPLSSSTHSS